jgi:hypothetical protein
MRPFWQLLVPVDRQRGKVEVKAPAGIEARGFDSMRKDYTASSPKKALLLSGNDQSFNGWIKKFDNHCSNHRHISSALNRLVADGISKQILLPWLYSASDLTRKPVRRLECFSDPSKRIERIATLLETGAQELLNLSPNLIFQILIMEYAPKTSACDVARIMKSSAQSLRELPRTRLSNSLSYHNLWKNLPTIVCVELAKRSKTRSPYKDLSHVMEAAYAGRGVSKTISSDELRNKYDHFVKSEVGNGMLMLAFDFFTIVKDTAKIFQVPT